MNPLRDTLFVDQEESGITMVTVATSMLMNM